MILIRPFVLRLALAAVIVFFFALLSRAGGPKCVAGTSYFNSSAAGQPLVWAGGIISYYTDQGDLSPAAQNGATNAMVADAFSQWTSIQTAAISATSGGQLGEDVSGSNVTVNSDRSISMPSDIQPTATATPVGIVYDSDGSVTDALLGAGAGGPGQCFFNAAFGGNDSYGPGGNYQHALIVINGQCAQEPSQLVDVEYRLVRVIGQVFGLGWSQANPNVITGNPAVTADDYAGFPVMHYADPTACAPITRCYSNPYQPALDDVAAISRLYPVTAANQSGFPGKQVFLEATARIHGSVWFTDSSGKPSKPMQGVNVVARWINPGNGLPSRQYVASSVSGFLFTGNAGNLITGTVDPLGDPYSQWGSADSTMEGFYDLAGLPLPSGTQAQYQLTVERLDPNWSTGVGPYEPHLVDPSGLLQPIVVTLKAGQDVEQDILMSASAEPLPQIFPTQTWTAPAHVPASGDWMASLSGYGDTAFFSLPAQANRTLSVAIRAVDEAGTPSEEKVQPVIGMWNAADPEGTAPPAFTASPFNTLQPGQTRLDAQVGTSGTFLIGISDLRGDGRPDYHYEAHTLYADSVAPARVGVNGGVVTVQGTGFAPGLAVNVAGIGAQPLAVDASQMILAVPAHADGPQSIAISDPGSGSSTSMTNALTYGAAASDKILLVGGGLNSSTPVGTPAVNPVKVRVVMADGATPVSGATIGWSATNGLQLSACDGTSSCLVATDESGNASTLLTPASAGVSAITATLAPGVYSPAKSVTATLSATESASDIGVVNPYVWIAQGATASVPLSARVLSNGTPQTNATVSFRIVSGAASLSAASAQTDSNGNAGVTLTIPQIAAPVQVSACVAPINTPCKPFYLIPVPLANLRLRTIAGGGQISASQPFQPLVIQVTDSVSPPDPIFGATVGFLTTVLRPNLESSDGTNPTVLVILSVSQSSGTSDVNGLVSIVPSNAGFSAPLEVNVGVSAGTSAALDFPLQLLPEFNNGNDSGTQIPTLRLPERIEEGKMRER